MAKNTQPAAAQSQQKYADLINKSQSQLQSEELDLKVQEAKSDLEVTIATTKRDLAVAKRKLDDAKASVPYNVHNELRAYSAVVELQNGLEFAQQVLAERF